MKSARDRLLLRVASLMVSRLDVGYNHGDLFDAIEDFCAEVAQEEPEAPPSEADDS